MKMDFREKFCIPGDERIILSFCFKSIDYFYELATKITERDFLVVEHQMIFMMLKNLVEQDVKAMDLAMLINQAQKSAVLSDIGGADYLQSVYNIEVSPENFNSYLTNVVEASTKYKAYMALHFHMKTIEDNAFTEKSSIELINSVESSMLDMTCRSVLRDEPVSLIDGLEEFINDRDKTKITMTGLSTSYPILDKQLDGMPKGSLTVIAARKKAGKSTFLTNVALNAAYNLKVPTLYIDTELNFTEWRTRALSRISGVKERKIRHGGFDAEERLKLRAALAKINDGKLYHKFMPGYSVDSIAALAKKYKIKENMGFLCFDYLKEPDSSSVDRGRAEHQILGDTTTRLKDLAGILDIPVLTAVQLGKTYDIADSDKIARYADVVALWQPRTEDERAKAGDSGGNYKLVIRDSRRGGTTGPEGIGYWFFREFLHIKEVNPADQYFISAEGEAVNHDANETSLYNEQVGTEVF